eukprot:gnl/MRDRNA2_/MRDRNA2_29551_c0_seq1.p1 gnl/MRDRNA2_/MRDRNA2_29551_c0~~gnl/MRDRNA2_/MRDRNA2_29551_c0_seq1.p1  ORF type:complete len:394 (+),score=66.49 gnl/MRDRNA2_/MRDRNA2_29551_c0_seq1:101-1282(+)
MCRCESEDHVAISSSSPSGVQSGMLLDEAKQMIQRDDRETRNECFELRNAAAQSRKSPSAPQTPQKVAFDECTVRVMFMEMDTDASGSITKEEFINYLRSRPQMQNVMYNAFKPGETGEQDSSPRASRVMGIKKIITLFKAVNQEGNGLATWDEFLDFFRRIGLLITYTTPNNPRDRLAGALANEYQQRQAVAKRHRDSAPPAFSADLGGTSCWNSKFSMDEKQQQFSSQWAAERRVQMQDEQHRIDASTQAARFRCQFTGNTGIRRVDSVPEGNQSVDMEAPNFLDLPSSSPKSPNLPCVWSPQSKRRGTEPDSVGTQDASNPQPEIEPLSPSVKLPAIKQPISPMGSPCSEKSPRKISARRHVENRRSTPPSRRGRTPRQSEFVPQVLCVN